ncbi:PGRP2 amidase, partial [Drymodes brunneopygia]|nr:PGRP2 amidase [Drymodes brunneopygia]
LRPPPPTPELGAVLAPDGSTVALGPLLAGIEVGLRSGGFGRPLPTLDPPADPLLAVTIAEALGTSFLLAEAGDNNATALGLGGCWDDVENPQNYTLRGPPSPVPDPVAIGAMDGVILGTRLAQGPLPLAELLRGYYGTGNGSEGGRPPSSYRRRDFGVLVGQGRLEKEVAAVLGVLRSLSPSPELLRDMGTHEVAAVALRAAREFSERYVECPAIVPRCLWGAQPYRGTPAPLRPPLGSVFLHHTLEPARPCRTFDACARAMRDMQHFHQDTRGWDDIGY